MNTNVEGTEREQELRKAMSLSYLKPEPAPQQPKHEKTPKPENIAALREALLSVMKTEGMTVTSPVPASSSPSTANASPAAAPLEANPQPQSSDSQNTAQEVPHESNSAAPTHGNSHNQQAKSQSHHKGHENKSTAEKIHHDSHKEAAPEKVGKEVGEAELKDIFAE